MIYINIVLEAELLLSYFRATAALPPTYIILLYLY